jgi:hypothetical protein
MARSGCPVTHFITVFWRKKKREGKEKRSED